MWMRSFVSPLARLVVALKERMSSFEGETCFCLSEAGWVLPRASVVAVAPAGLLDRPVLVFLVFILYF